MNKISGEECVVVRRELFQALLNIFGEELGEASIDHLPQMRKFTEHATYCRSCAALGKELARALSVKFDLKKIKTE